VNILVTAGPTREYLDEVRFISNASTGRMGCAIARAAADAKHQVRLIHGPLACPVPENVSIVKVVSANEMLAALKAHIEEAQILIMTAAVADYRPQKQLKGKLRKADIKSLALVQTPDILTELGKNKGARIHVGFSMETENYRERAMQKMQAKNLDFIVTNGPGNLGHGFKRAEVIERDGSSTLFTDMSKETFSCKLLHAVIPVALSRKGEKAT